jgi:hypothetical protein
MCPSAVEPPVVPGPTGVAEDAVNTISVSGVNLLNVKNTFLI